MILTHIGPSPIPFLPFSCFPSLAFPPGRGDVCTGVHSTILHTEISLKDKKKTRFAVDEPYTLVRARRFLSSGHEAVKII